MVYFQRIATTAEASSLLVAWLRWLRPRKWLGNSLKQRRQLECLERLPLGPQHSLHLVRAGERLMLVSSSPGGCQLIGHLAAADIPEPQGEGR